MGQGTRARQFFWIAAFAAVLTFGGKAVQGLSWGDRNQALTNLIMLPIGIALYGGAAFLIGMLFPLRSSGPGELDNSAETDAGNGEPKRTRQPVELRPPELVTERRSKSPTHHFETTSVGEANASQSDPYATAGGELLSGDVDRGAWARALVDGNGEDGPVKAAYIRYRVARIQELRQLADENSRQLREQVLADEAIQLNAGEEALAAIAARGRANLAKCLTEKEVG